MTGEAGDGGPVQVFVDLTRFAAATARPRRTTSGSAGEVLALLG